MKRLTGALLFALLVTLAGWGSVGEHEAHAQDARLLPAEDPVYTYIDRLQRRGHLLQLHPTAQPYTVGEIRRALDRTDGDGLSAREQRWLRAVEQHAGLIDREGTEAMVGGSLQAGVSSANTDRQESLVRPTGDGQLAWSSAELRVFGAAGPAIAQVGLRHDLYYDQDPDGLSPVRRLKARNENSYVGVQGRYARLYVGRFSNHWAMHGEQAGLLSSNPRPYDQINFRIGGERLSVQGLVVELDNIAADDRFTGNARGPDSRSRIFTASRLDWRPSKRLAFSLQESLIYEGTRSGIMPFALAPSYVLFFVGDNAPANALDQLLVSASVWAQVGKATVHVQGVVDDIVIENRAELIEDERIQPSMFALYGSLRLGGVTDRLDLGLETGLASFQVYNNRRAIMRYVYLNRGLANQFTDYVDVSGFADVYLDDIISGLTLTPRVTFLAQGEQRLTQEFVRNRPDGSIIETLLTGTTEQTLRWGLQGYFQPDPRFFIRFDAGLNHVWNEAHEEGQRRTRFIGLLEVGARFSLNRGVSLDFP